MHLYLDTADQDAAEVLLGTGLFTGLTTNPTILQRASRGVADIPEIYRWATAAGGARGVLPGLGPRGHHAGRAR